MTDDDKTAEERIADALEQLVDLLKRRNQPGGGWYFERPSDAGGIYETRG